MDHFGLNFRELTGYIVMNMEEGTRKRIRYLSTSNSNTSITKYHGNQTDTDLKAQFLFASLSFTQQFETFNAIVQWHCNKAVARIGTT